MDDTGTHKNGNQRLPWLSKRNRGEFSSDAEPPQPERGRVFFSPAWSKAANEGLISDEEYIAELERHSRAENERTIPGIPWRQAHGNKQIGTR